MERLAQLTLLALLSAPAPAQWLESRTVFRGTDRERLEAIPYYYPYTGDPGFGWGFFYDYGRLPVQYRSEAYQRSCFRQMANYGLNTLTIYGWHGSEDLADVGQQAQWAFDERLAQSFPVMVLPCGEPAAVAAPIRNGLPTGFPEIIGYGHDEPQATAEARAAAQDITDKWHEVGMRCATAISADSAKVVGDPLDIIIVHAPKLSEAAPRDGQELWMYDCELRGTNFALHRYWAGVYSYAANRRKGVRSAWLWSYVNDANSGVFRNEDGSLDWHPLRVHDHALVGPDGPLPTVGLEGLREGITDFKLLRECERRGVGKGWINNLIAKVKLDFWKGTDHPEGPVGYWWDVPDIAKPMIDCAEVREKCCAFLAEPSPD